jgi:prepilin-type N-terminal cleavage/methylation domain-containing protein/prepilin-type processing-associated H-X9-DG protein
MKASIISRSGRRGFTLIELLVVIAIIAILAAILFPVFAKAREKARQTACLSNEKQIGLGLLQYEQDFDEALPYIWYGTNGGGSAAGGNYKWMDAVYPYIKSDAVFSCPDATYPQINAQGNFYPYHYYQNYAGLTPTPAGNGVGGSGNNFYYGSYGLNAMYRLDNSGGTSRTPPCGAYAKPTTIATLQSPSSTVWIADGVNYYFGWACLTAGNASVQPNPTVNTNASPIQTNNPATYANEVLIGRHTNMTNAIFCDGHAKSQTLPNMVANQRADGTLINFIVEAQ